MKAPRARIVLIVIAAACATGAAASMDWAFHHRAAYDPIDEVIEPAASFDTRSVAVKDWHLYLLERTGDLHVYDVSDLAHVTGFVTYDMTRWSMAVP